MAFNKNLWNVGADKLMEIKEGGFIYQPPKLIEKNIKIPTPIEIAKEVDGKIEIEKKVVDIPKKIFEKVKQEPIFVESTEEEKTANATAASEEKTRLEAVERVEARVSGYGTPGEQLDEIFHNIDDWRARIQAVKAANVLEPGDKEKHKAEKEKNV